MELKQGLLPVLNCRDGQEQVWSPMDDRILIPVVAEGCLALHTGSLRAHSVQGCYSSSASRALGSREDAVHPLSRALGAQAQEFHNL